MFDQRARRAPSFKLTFGTRRHLTCIFMPHNRYHQAMTRITSLDWPQSMDFVFTVLKDQDEGVPQQDSCNLMRWTRSNIWERQDEWMNNVARMT